MRQGRGKGQMWIWKGRGARGRIQIRSPLCSCLCSHWGWGGLLGALWSSQHYWVGEYRQISQQLYFCGFSTTAVMAWTDSPRWHLRRKSKRSSGRCLETEFGTGLLQKAARYWLRGWREKSTAFSEGSYVCGSFPRADFSFLQIKYPEDKSMGVERGRALKMPPSRVECLLLEIILQVLTQKRAFRAYHFWAWLKRESASSCHMLCRHSSTLLVPESVDSDSFTKSSALLPVLPGPPSSSWLSKMESCSSIFLVHILFSDNKTNKQCTYHFQSIFLSFFWWFGPWK